jgi:hypothetical protein
MRYKHAYEFTDPDGEELGLSINYSFGYPSICLWTEDAETKDLNGIRMTCDETRKLISELQKLVDEGEAWMLKIKKPI